MTTKTCLKCPCNSSCDHEQADQHDCMARNPNAPYPYSYVVESLDWISICNDCPDPCEGRAK